MKTLYLHCGTNKTGSSFLQSLFTRNRDLLKSRKIYYPFSHAEYDMLAGNISPGNGLELSKSLSEADLKSTLKILQDAAKEAQKAGSESVLFSSEYLFHEFGKEGTVKELKKAAKEAGFSQIKALVYFRDPVSHALSTYKHRAKRGDHKDFERWIAHHYEMMGLFEKFEKYSSTDGIAWYCRKYSKNAAFMAESSFKDWLKLPVPEISRDDRVNKSLSLSEIRILQVLKEIDPDTIPILQKNFYDLSREEKKSDPQLEQNYIAVASRVLEKYNPLLKEINRHLPEAEKLSIRDDLPYSNVSVNGAFYLAPYQMELVIRAVQETEHAKALGSRLAQLWNKGVVKVKRHIKAKGL